MAFPQWATSRWTVLAYRALITVSLTMVLPFVAWMMFRGGGEAIARVQTVEATIADVSAVQGARARDSEAFQTEVRGAISDLKDQIADVKDDVFATKVDVGVIKRLVTELRQRSDVATNPLLAVPPAMAMVLPAHER